MPQLGSLTTVKKCRRRHECWWCGEEIPIGSAYDKWTWEEDRSLSTIKCHPECRAAWNDAAAEEGGPFYVMFGEFERPNLTTDESGVSF